MSQDALREKVVAIARGILDGETEVLEGSRILSGLLGRLSLGDDDEDHRAFVLIDSETDALPVSRARAHWSAESLLELDPRFRDAQKWALAIAEPHCSNLIKRFAPVS
ncbi:MAG TPA: DUF2489 domain-containing protein [Polyangia bacterium]|jgi:hypothetical protein|nr:DUF2489 domain-containing protein [Polyangia bacterium]